MQSMHTPATGAPTACQEGEERRFRPKWQAGRPWLQHAKGVMWCAACWEYP